MAFEYATFHTLFKRYVSIVELNLPPVSNTFIWGQHSIRKHGCKYGICEKSSIMCQWITVWDNEQSFHHMCVPVARDDVKGWSFKLCCWASVVDLFIVKFITSEVASYFFAQHVVGHIIQMSICKRYEFQLSQ